MRIAIRGNVLARQSELGSRPFGVLMLPATQCGLAVIRSMKATKGLAGCARSVLCRYS
jgi:hypothetical protein